METWRSAGEEWRLLMDRDMRGSWTGCQRCFCIIERWLVPCDSVVVSSDDADMRYQDARRRHGS